MISCAVVVPSAPLLVPELAPGSGYGDEVRAAAVSAAAQLPTRWVAVGTGSAAPVESGRVGTFRGFGRDVVVPLGIGAAGEPEDLPLPVLIAAWLRGQVGAGSVRAELIGRDAAPDECAALGEKLAADDDSGETGLLVLGDGSARRNTAPPGDADDRAKGFDAAVAAALGEADTGALAALDPVLAHELRAEGRAPWQVLAGVARARGGRWRGEPVYSGAPRGVGYHVAVWRQGDLEAE